MLKRDLPSQGTIAAGGKVDKFKDKSTLLLEACQSGNTETVQSLRADGVEIDFSQKKANEILSNAIKEKKENDVKLVQLLLKGQKNIQNIRLYNTRYTFDVMDMSNGRGAHWMGSDDEFEDVFSFTPMQVAVFAQRSDMIPLLVELGDNINVTLDFEHDLKQLSSDGESYYGNCWFDKPTIICFAVKAADVEIVKSLIDNGADLLAKDTNGKNIRSYNKDGLDTEEPEENRMQIDILLGATEKEIYEKYGAAAIKKLNSSRKEVYNSGKKKEENCVIS